MVANGGNRKAVVRGTKACAGPAGEFVGGLGERHIDSVRPPASWVDSITSTVL